MTSDEDRVRIARLCDDIEAFAEVPELSRSGGEVMQTIETRLKEIGNELRTKVEPLARRAYSAARDVIAAPDHEEPRPNRAVLARMIAWFEAEDEEPKAE